MLRNTRPPRQAGFTLLELLVVMAVVLLVLGLAVVKLDDQGERAMRNSAERLAIALESARDAALYSGVALAFSSDGEGYQFWREDDRSHKWMVFAGEESLRAARFGTDIQLAAQSLNGHRRPLGERLVFSPEGLSEPYTLELARDSLRLRLTSDVLGRIELGPVTREELRAP